jgi:hypothetical protein
MSWVPRSVLFEVHWLIDFFYAVIILGLDYIPHFFLYLESGFFLILEIDVYMPIIPTPRFKWTWIEDDVILLLNIPFLTRRASIIVIEKRNPLDR